MNITINKIFLSLLFLVCLAWSPPVYAEFPLDTSPEVPVGFGGSIPAGTLPEADKEIIRNIPLQNLLDLDTGRYAVLQESGEMGFWGLSELWTRRDAGNKPYAALRDSQGIYQTERVVFADPSSGVMVMKLTDQPYDDGGDELIYFGKSNFSADGSRMFWQRSKKPVIWGPSGVLTSDIYGPLLLNGDGTGPRIAFRELPSVRNVVGSPINPRLGYGRAGRDLVEVDLMTGQVLRTVAKEIPTWWLKISPDGLYTCSATYRTGRITVVRLSDGHVWDIPLSARIHDSYRFVPGNTDWIMYWFEGSFPTTTLTNFKTGETITREIGFDWNHGDVGPKYGIHTGGKVWEYAEPYWNFLTSVMWPTYDFVDQGPWYDKVYDYNGYAAYQPTDQLWAYVTRIVQRPYLSELEAVWIKPFAGGGRTNRFRLGLTNLYRRRDRKNNRTVVLDRPNISSDGTKLLFNSNVFGKAEVYLTTVKRPEKPLAVAALWSEDDDDDSERGDDSEKVTVSWSRPDHHKEIAGYRVYRSNESGRGFVLLNSEPLAALEYVDTGVEEDQVYFYAVRSVEHSGLESELSAEAGVAEDDDELEDAERRLFAEAEDGLEAGLHAPTPDGLWHNVEGMASNLYYLWQRRADLEGRVSLEMNIPREDAYYVFARIKGDHGAQFVIGGQSITADPGSSWQWVRSARALELPAGTQAIEIRSSFYGSRIDCIYLSTDAGFVPQGRVSAEVPAVLDLSGSLEEGYPRLSWSASNDSRFYYYNLYVADNPDFTPSKETLIASPDRTSYLDWRAREGARYYKVTQVSLDGLESEPSAAFNPYAVP